MIVVDKAVPRRQRSGLGLIIKVWGVGWIVNPTAAALLSKSCLSMVDLSPKFLFSLSCLALLLCTTFPPCPCLTYFLPSLPPPFPKSSSWKNIWVFEIWINMWHRGLRVAQTLKSVSSQAKGGNESNLLNPNDVLPAIDLGRKSSGSPLTTRHHLASHPFCHHRQVSPL